MKEHLKVLRNASMGLLVKKYSANGLFFTNEEFEQNKGEILMVGGVLFRISEKILKELPETIS